jgi:hypothetical protein
MAVETLAAITSQYKNAPFFLFTTHHRRIKSIFFLAAPAIVAATLAPASSNTKGYKPSSLNRSRGKSRRYNSGCGKEEDGLDQMHFE